MIPSFKEAAKIVIIAALGIAILKKIPATAKFL